MIFRIVKKTSSQNDCVNYGTKYFLEAKILFWSNIGERDGYFSYEDTLKVYNDLIKRREESNNTQIWNL